MRKSLCLCLFVFMFVTVSRNLTAQETAPKIGPETKQDSGSKDSGAKVDRETAEKLLPVQYLYHDGTNFLYQGNCCSPDAGANNPHMGMVVSAIELQTQTCPSNGGTTGNHIPTDQTELPEEFGDGNTGIELLISKTADFSTETQTFPIAQFANTANQFTNYYGNDVLGTSVKLKDQADKTRVFSLVKVSFQVNVAGGAIETKSFPVLTISRFSASLMQMQGGFPNVVTPIKQLHQQNGYSVAIADLDIPQTSVVTINVPDPANPNDPTKNKDIKCLMINRKL